MAEQSMIERVARAILAKVPQGYGMYEQEAREYAKAAIEAMREPSHAMKLVGGLRCEAMMFENDPEYSGVIFNDMAVVFRDMIDAALQDSEHAKHE